MPDGSFDDDLRAMARELMLEGDPDVVPCSCCRADATLPGDPDEAALCERCAHDLALDRDQQRILDEVRGK